jgi:hypothetical protein
MCPSCSSRPVPIVGRERDDVIRMLVEAVPLQLLRHALLLHEYRGAKRAQRCLAGLPVDRLDGERKGIDHGRHYKWRRYR